MNRFCVGMLCMLPFFGCSEKITNQPIETIITIPNVERNVVFDDASTLWSNYHKDGAIDTLTKVCTLRDTIASADVITFRHLWEFHRVYVEPGDQITVKRGDRNKVTFQGSAESAARNELYNKVLTIHDTYSNYIRRKETAERLHKEFTGEPVSLEDVLSQSQKAIDDFKSKKIGVTPAFLSFINIERKYFEIRVKSNFPNRVKKTYHVYTDEELNRIKQCVEDSKIKEAMLSQSYRAVAKAYTDYLRINDPEKKLVYGTDYMKNEFALGDYFPNKEVGDMIRAYNLAEIAFESGVLPEYTELVNQLPAKWRSMLKQAGKSSAKRKTVGQQAEFPEITGKDANGKTVSLKDFRGKWVLIDCWATWCGVCHGEIPYTNAMEKAFEGQNLVFFGASVDKEKDTQKWKDCLIEKEMKGIQIIVDDAQSLKEQLGIKGFPTYAIINPEGKLVMTRAPRPSSGVLHHLMKAYVSEK